MKNYTYCYYITEDEKVSELLVSYVSLMATNPQYPVSCIVGKLMSKEAIDFIKEIDKGDSYYAPQFIREENRPIMIGWMEMWSKNN